MSMSVVVGVIVAAIIVIESTWHLVEGRGFIAWLKDEIKKLKGESETDNK